MIVSLPTPVPKGLFQPSPCSSIGAAFGLGADEVAVACAVGLAEGVAADDQRRRLLVVHRHPAERLADVDRGRQRIRLAFGAFGIDVDQAHRGRRRTARRRSRSPE